MNLTKEIVELFINLRNDYGFYLTHIGVQDTPVSAAVHDCYFHSQGRKTIVMEPMNGTIFNEIKYQLKELGNIFGDEFVLASNSKYIKLENESYFVLVRDPLGLKGFSYSHLLVLDGFQNKKYFDEIVYPVAASCNAKVSIIPK
ncbi:hypothetical protein [Aeromonas phage AS-yj]|uniref:Uncharacterized protein n=3 Tax=Ceceduovirus TaxID=2842588 RepID=A0A223LDG7_9CAUD|nr:hypothetical protein HWB28_gp042 [Aeromonas phage AS-zj]YP_009834974.1 hypothetical protein HWB29_gp272 [Aeromonas phage AS-sw]ASU00510.1 hypothetical protein [Aeromonas phage AS-zj]ATI18023.1 hypothetical protein [Aeromonas phage AS-yj]ATI18322.1 hypothetical protein [Aeromonas phage AS-sw]